MISHPSIMVAPGGAVVKTSQLKIALVGGELPCPAALRIRPLSRLQQAVLSEEGAAVEVAAGQLAGRFAT
jgi:hypothetical protein